MITRMKRKSDFILDHLQQYYPPFNALSVPALIRASERLRDFTLHHGEQLTLRGGAQRDYFYVIRGRVMVRKDQEERILDAEADVGSLFFFPPESAPLHVATLSDALVCHVEGSALDEIIAWDQLARDSGLSDNAEETLSLGKLMETRALRKLPLEAVEEVFQRVRKLRMEAGTEVVRQGERGDAFYLLLSGKAEVWRQDIDDEEQQLVATLTNGDAFGEESLILGGNRNATVRLTVESTLLRLDRQDFDQLIAAPLISRVNAQLAHSMIENGYGVIDVRYEEEYEEKFIPGSRLIPLPRLRGQLQQLDPNRGYLVVCASGKRACVGALLLRQHRVKEVAVLDGGIRDWPFETHSAY